MTNVQMEFPETWEEYEQEYGFNDTDEVCTNNSRLIPSFRVKQWLDHLSNIQPKTGHWIDIDEEPHEDYECDNCGYVVSTYTANIEPHTEYKYCPNCGAKMKEVD